jgi:cell division protein FtsB
MKKTKTFILEVLRRFLAKMKKLHYNILGRRRKRRLINMIYFLIILTCFLIIGLVISLVIGKGKQTKIEDDNAHLKHLLDIYAADEEDYREEIAVLKKNLNDAFESEQK